MDSSSLLSTEVSQIKKKRNELKKEYDLFEIKKGESFESLIARYSWLVSEMKRIGIENRDCDYIEQLADILVDTLPDVWGDYILSIQTNPKLFNELNLDRFIKMLRDQNSIHCRAKEMKERMQRPTSGIRALELGIYEEHCVLPLFHLILILNSC